MSSRCQATATPVPHRGLPFSMSAGQLEDPAPLFGTLSVVCRLTSRELSQEPHNRGDHVVTSEQLAVVGRKRRDTVDEAGLSRACFGEAWVSPERPTDSESVSFEGRDPRAAKRRFRVWCGDAVEDIGRQPVSRPCVWIQKQRVSSDRSSCGQLSLAARSSRPQSRPLVHYIFRSPIAGHDRCTRVNGHLRWRRPNRRVMRPPGACPSSARASCPDSDRAAHGS